ncbi:MAG: DUF4268 domain-containing protein [Oscillospiraceae bacterium]|nr:DUF4268 domain-containing protein [Oscillospiraceae bacterium]
MANIGKLKEVDVRDLWKHEQYDFSKWLAKDENIEYLNEILGLTLVAVDNEVYVGPYRCDLVAKDETSGITVIVENQLEGTNHDHLGKIITYASGLDAKVIVWIVKEAKEEHRAAIEWLNNNTSTDINFFLIEIHAYKIGDSDPAPKFEVVEKPNDFVKRSKTKDREDGEMNKSQAARLYFWEEFNKVVAQRGKPFNIRKATTDHWYDVAVGSSDAHISITLVNKFGNIVVELYISNNKALFDKLKAQKDSIESDLGFALDWDRLGEQKKASRIKYYIDGLDFEKQDNYSELMNTAIDVAVKMRDVFKRYM